MGDAATNKDCESVEKVEKLIFLFKSWKISAQTWLNQ